MPGAKEAKTGLQLEAGNPQDQLVQISPIHDHLQTTSILKQITAQHQMLAFSNYLSVIEGQLSVLKNGPIRLIRLASLHLPELSDVAKQVNNTCL